MFVYHASEKDCVGQDGEGVQECVICFEEFAVGDEMGRLECLCKFHRVSLRVRVKSFLNGKSTLLIGTNRHVYGNGGIRKVRAFAPCMRKGSLEPNCRYGSHYDYYYFEHSINNAFSARLILWVLAR